MYKRTFATFLNFTLLLVLLGDVKTLMEGSNTQVRKEQRIADTFQASIPEHFEKIGAKYYYIENNQTFNWFGAAQKCRQIDSNLINLQTQSEVDNVGLRLNSSLEYWTDLNNLVKLSSFYSLTTGTKASFLNDKEDNGKGHDINTCGLLKFDNNTSKFTLSMRKCVSSKAYFICETRNPSTITFLLW